MQNLGVMYHNGSWYFGWNKWNIHLILLYECWPGAAWWAFYFSKMWNHSNEIWIARFLRKKLGNCIFKCRSHDNLEVPEPTLKAHLTVLWSIILWKLLSHTEWKRRLIWKQCESELVDFAFEDRLVHFPLQIIEFLYISEATSYSRAPP